MMTLDFTIPDLAAIVPILFAATDTFWRFLGEMGDVICPEGPAGNKGHRPPKENKR